MLAPKTDNNTVRFLRFVLTGLVNTGFGLGVYVILVLAGLAAQTALAIAFAVGVMWNYWTHARFVFGTSGFGKLLPYAACYLVLYVLNVFALGGLIARDVHPILAQTILAPIAAVLSFLLIGRVLTGDWLGRGNSQAT